jgi:hypothetical protein
MSPDDPSRIVATVEHLGLVLKQGPSDADPDAVLVALGRKFEALSAELATLQKEEDALSSSARQGGASTGQQVINPPLERIEAVLTLLDPIERAIMAVPARTVVGLGARAVRLLIESTCNVAGVGLLPSQQ